MKTYRLLHDNGYITTTRFDLVDAINYVKFGNNGIVAVVTPNSHKIVYGAGDEN